MRYFRYAVLSLFALLMVSACQDEEMKGDNTGEIRFTLNVSGAKTTRTATTDALPGESLITNVYLWFYPKGTNTPAYFFSAQDLNATGSWECNLPVSDLKYNLEAGRTYDMYVLASLPSEIAAPGKRTYKQELLEFTETQYDRASAAVPFAFTGIETFAYDPENGNDVSVSLARTVARVDITVEGLQEGQTVDLRLDQASTTPYWSEGGVDTQPNITTVPEVVSPDSPNRYRAYIYENHPGQPAQLYVTVTHIDSSPPAVYKPRPINNGKVERNKVYDVQVNLD